jgi:hypothetical protein
MASLTDAAESRILNFITGNAGATAPTAPLKLRLMTANGADIVVTGMPACTVIGWELWDSAGTPFRWMHDTMTSKTVNAGDDFKVPAGSLSFTAD